jgi:hypothetical protein
MISLDFVNIVSSPLSGFAIEIGDLIRSFAEDLFLVINSTSRRWRRRAHLIILNNQNALFGLANKWRGVPHPRHEAGDRR